MFSYAYQSQCTHASSNVNGISKWLVEINKNCKNMLCTAFGLRREMKTKILGRKIAETYSREKSFFLKHVEDKKYRLRLKNYICKLLILQHTVKALQ